jgi:hypothetical protein
VEGQQGTDCTTLDAQYQLGARDRLARLIQEAIKKSPEWNPTAPINRDYEARLYDYYGHTVYWNENERPSKPAPTPGD